MKDRDAAIEYLALPPLKTLINVVTTTSTWTHLHTHVKSAGEYSRLTCLCKLFKQNTEVQCNEWVKEKLFED